MPCLELVDLPHLLLQGVPHEDVWLLFLLQLNQIGCTVTFTDPYALAAFHAFLLCKMDVRRTKNKFLPPMGPLLGPGEMMGDGAPRESSEYQDVLVNILWLVERISHAVEVQLALHDLDQIRYFSTSCTKCIACRATWSSSISPSSRLSGGIGDRLNRS
jgi:hypothetical protein